MTIALTKLPNNVSKIYAANLFGSAIGCLAIIYSMRHVGGPTVAVLVSALIAFGAFLFFPSHIYRKQRFLSLFIGIALLMFVGAHSYLESMGISLFRLMWVKGQIEYRPLYEKWNSYSRIAVDGDLSNPLPPWGWGLSPIYQSENKFRQLHLDIDSVAGTRLMEFSGDIETLEFLKYDITNLAHYLRNNATVLTIGVGGGRDILSALAFQQKQVLGIEINEDIIKAVNQVYGDLTGHLDKHPKVRFIHDEARSYIARTDECFDIIQVSLIDTWAASAAGAFVLAEQTLYTLEAWDLFLNHLTDQGILSFSRWYDRESPDTMYRLTSLAVAALKRAGIDDTRQHIAIARRMYGGEDDNHPTGIGTILVSKRPFSEIEISSLTEICDQLKFNLVLSPTFSIDNTFQQLSSGKNLEQLYSRYPLNISPPTDDKPYFFHMLKFSDLFNRNILFKKSANVHNIKAVLVLGILLLVVITLTLCCIIIPLLFSLKTYSLRGALPISLVFIAIGLGFMLIELSFLQRLIVFLGHPTYGLTVVLFSILLSCGIGSYSTRNICLPQDKNTALSRISMLIIILVIFGIFTRPVLEAFQATITIYRIIISVTVLLPIGIFMGMVFPLGMKVASSHYSYLTPWLWGINGAMSVLASVLAVIFSIYMGIETTFWIGFIFYGIAFLSYAKAVHRINQ